jgi:hypothetical protein
LIPVTVTVCTVLHANGENVRTSLERKASVGSDTPRMTVTMEDGRLDRSVTNVSMAALSVTNAPVSLEDTFSNTKAMSSTHEYSCEWWY